MYNILSTIYAIYISLLSSLGIVFLSSGGGCTCEYTETGDSRKTPHVLVAELWTLASLGPPTLSLPLEESGSCRHESSGRERGLRRTGSLGELSLHLKDILHVVDNYTSLVSG